MKKENNPLPMNENFMDEEDFAAFIDAVEKMEPEEARIMYQNIIATMEEEGELVPFSLRLLTSDIVFGLTQTSVGLIYGIGGLEQLLLTGFISQEDIDELGDAETVLQTIMEDFEENMTTAIMVRDDNAIEKLVKAALEGSYIVNEEVFDVMDATDLQQQVWKEMTKIPYGTTISYEELALRIGNPKAVRAVASAVGENPLSIAIPCHRIIRKKGEVGEYHWGADIKEKLLAYEKAKKQA